jgi:hypothetical protein
MASTRGTSIAFPLWLAVSKQQMSEQQYVGRPSKRTLAYQEGVKSGR